VVRNGAGETEFGRDQYFQVASNNALPVPLLAPPSFLRDKLDGMAKAGKGTQGKAAEAQASGSSSTSETTSPAPNSFTQSLSTSTLPTTYQPLESPVAQTSTTQQANTTLISGSWTYAYAEAGLRTYTGGYSGKSTNTWGAYNSVETLFNLPLPTAISPYTPLAFYLNAFGPFTQTDTYDGVTYTSVFTKTASTNTGSFAGAEGAFYWGRYSSTDNLSNSSLSFTENEINHWATGPAVSSLPTSGLFTFTHVGGTQPTDLAGNAGTLTSGGSWSVNFGNRTIYSASYVTWTMGGISYAVGIPSGSPATWSTYGPTTDSSSSSGGTYSSTDSGVSTLSRTGTTWGGCSGGGCTMTNVSFSPQFMGATATGLAVGIATTATTSSGTQNTAQVQVYKR
jgi:hypothetical protein